MYFYPDEFSIRVSVKLFALMISCGNEFHCLVMKHVKSILSITAESAVFQF